MRSTGQRRAHGARLRPALLAVTAILTAIGTVLTWTAIPLLPASGAGAGAGAGAALAKPDIGYNTQAFGTQLDATLAGLVNASSGPSALTTIGCTTRPGLHSQNSTVGVKLPELGTIGAVTTSADTARIGPKAQAHSTARTASLDLLDGAIKAQAVQSEAYASVDENGAHARGVGSSKLLGLTIDGKAEPASPPADTSIPLPGIGQVILNQQVVGKRVGYTWSTTVRALYVDITVANNPTGLPVGATLVVSKAEAAVSGPVIGKLGHVAYGTSLVHLPVVSGPTFPEFLSCFGTGGVTQTDSGANVSAGGISASAVKETVMGIDSPRKPLEARLSSTVTGLSLGTLSVPGVPSLPGLPSTLLAAAVIRSDANATTHGGGQTTLTETGSEILGLKVAGETVPLGALPAENTSIPIPGVGTLYLNRVMKTATTIEVRMVDLVISNTALAAAIGAPELWIADAKARS